MRPFSRASAALYERDSVTAFSAHSTGRPRCAASDRANAAASFVIFSSMTSDTPSPEPIGTGWAAPAFVPGAIAATSAAISTKKPADPACPPAGVTYTATGLFAAVSAVVASRSDTSRPPGVSTSIRVSAAPRSSASFSPRSR
jgi:hypothetical protein